MHHEGGAGHRGAASCREQAGSLRTESPPKTGSLPEGRGATLSLLCAGAKVGSGVKEQGACRVLVAWGSSVPRASCQPHILPGCHRVGGRQGQIAAPRHALTPNPQCRGLPAPPPLCCPQAARTSRPGWSPAPGDKATPCVQGRTPELPWHRPPLLPHVSCVPCP